MVFSDEAEFESKLITALFDNRGAEGRVRRAKLG